jgi:hypothetical protein
MQQQNRRPQGQDNHFAPFVAMMILGRPDLIRLERYDRRAWSQQKRVIGEFMNIKLMRKLQNASTNAT